MNYNITTHLLLVVVFEGILVTFLESSKGQIHFRSPPDLSTSKSNLHVQQNSTVMQWNALLWTLLGKSYENLENLSMFYITDNVYKQQGGERVGKKERERERERERE